MTERQAWICLASVSGVADEQMGLLMARFGSATDVLTGALDGSLQRWSAARWRMEARAALPAAVIRGLAEVAADPGSKLDQIEQLGLWTLTPLDDDYPTRLRDLDPPPGLLHGWGDPAALSTSRAVALVGTRRPTPAGRMLAARLAARLVECRATVVSGLAVGIDGAAHAGTVERDGRTVAVIGAGHLSPGPQAHASLRTRIVAAGGAVISEHHPNVRATKGTYPRRNRIIAALAEAVLVVEAPLRSGALITARHALELGRPVFVAPGRVGDWSTAGALGLLRETPARPLVGLDELVADLGYFALPGSSVAPAGPASRQAALAMLGGAERAVAQRLCQSPAGLDVLVHDTELEPATVSGAVTLLLMRGWAQAIGPAYLPAGPLLG
ncbi:DNA-processing protein DprA [soil metagenome]